MNFPHTDTNYLQCKKPFLANLEITVNLIKVKKSLGGQLVEIHS